MFIRKLFSSKNKLLWVLIDLLIVIIGVYCAFLIQQSAERKRDKESQDRVLTALKYELETFRFYMTNISGGMAKMYRELNQVKFQGKYKNFSNYRFIEPQYDYQAIEYALSLQNTTIIDFELNESLQGLWVEIKKIEHVKRLLTSTSMKYQSLPRTLDETSTAYQLLWAENFDNFGWYLMFIKDRSSIANQVAQAATTALELINDRLGEQKARELEAEIIRKYIRRIASSEEEAIELGQVFYPKLSEEEIRSLYREAELPVE